jgi:hypothetical protein
MDDGGLVVGVHPFPSHRRMVLRETPCSRANALTFIEVVFEFGVGSGPISVFSGWGLVPSVFSLVAVARPHS